MAGSANPDVIVLDVGLPDIDGIEVMRQLVAQRVSPPVPVVCVSGHAMAEDAARAMDAGITRYLTKPINTRTFAKEVLDVLELSRSGGASRP